MSWFLAETNNPTTIVASGGSDVDGSISELSYDDYESIVGV